jgi:hypothetical protein
MKSDEEVLIYAVSAGSGIRDQDRGLRGRSDSAAAVLQRNALAHHQPPFTNAPVTLFRRLDGPPEIALGAIPPDMRERTFDRLSDTDVWRGVGAAVRTLLGHAESQAIGCHPVQPERNKDGMKRQSGRSLRGLPELVLNDADGFAATQLRADSCVSCGPERSGHR